LGWLHTSGNQIETASGQNFVFFGAAIVVTNYGWSNPNGDTGGNWNEGLFAALKEDGGNSVRVTLTYWQYSAAYTAFIDQVVKWCAENSLYVILDIHLGDPHSTTGPQDDVKIMQNPNEDLSTILTPAPGDAPYPSISWIGLLQYYAQHYANNPTVSMIDILNEPTGNQGTDSYLFGLWDSAAQLAINAIHAVNPDVLVGVYGMSWGNSLVDFYNHPLVGTNIVYAAEGAYMAWQVGWEPFANDYLEGNYAQGKIDYISYLNEQDIISMSQKYPVMIMEWGSQQAVQYNATLDPAYIRWMGDALQIFSQHGLGSEYWAWDISGMGSDEHGVDLYKVDQGLLDWQNWQNHLFVPDARGQLWEQYGSPESTQTPVMTSTSQTTTLSTTSQQTASVTSTSTTTTSTSIMTTTSTTVTTTVATSTTVTSKTSITTDTSSTATTSAVTAASSTTYTQSTTTASGVASSASVPDMNSTLPRTGFVFAIGSSGQVTTSQTATAMATNQGRGQSDNSTASPEAGSASPQGSPVPMLSLSESFIAILGLGIGVALIHKKALL